MLSHVPALVPRIDDAETPNIFLWLEVNFILQCSKTTNHLIHLPLQDKENRVIMSSKPFEQVYPGQNASNLQPKKDMDPKEWERKLRMKEYRISARREKRNRKSDEKKQRKLNATILRRMTRNPDKYSKNASRNQAWKIQAERRRIQTNAVAAAERLAAVYDPSGAMFNVGPVVTLEDGSVKSLATIKRNEEIQAEQEARRAAAEEAGHETKSEPKPELNPWGQPVQNRGERGTQGLSKTQQKKLAENAYRPPPPKPIIPDGIDLPSDEEENWLSLWDITDQQCLVRVQKAKTDAARERKLFRKQQQSGKLERRAARDEKRKVYRSIKDSWQIIRQEERKRRKYLGTIENQERRRLAVQVSLLQRKQALETAAELGFTLGNVPGVDDIKPQVHGMKGVTLDFSKIHYDGEKLTGLTSVGNQPQQNRFNKKRVNLGAAPAESHIESVFPSQRGSGANTAPLGQQDFVSFDNAGGKEDAAQPPAFNHHTRRKILHAMENAQIEKELLVRAAATAHCEAKGIPVPAIFATSGQPVSIPGQRTMPNGELETDKQVRNRAKVDLTEFNVHAKVLRGQAKEMALEAGIRIYLELMGTIPAREGIEEERQRVAANLQSINGPAAVQQMTGMADLIANWPMPDEDLGQLEGAFDDYYAFGQETSKERQNGVANGQGMESGSEEGEIKSESEEEDSDDEMSDS